MKLFHTVVVRRYLKGNTKITFGWCTNPTLKVFLVLPPLIVNHVGYAFTCLGLTHMLKT